MKQNYEIDGMTSEECMDKIKNSLMRHQGITDVKIQMEPPRAFITMSRDLDVDELQTMVNVAGNYKIREVVYNMF